MVAFHHTHFNIKGYPLAKYEWYIPFTTHKTGFFDLSITSNQVITNRLAADSLRPRSFSIPIVWFSNLKVFELLLSFFN